MSDHAIENDHGNSEFLAIKLVIVHSYFGLPEGICSIKNHAAFYRTQWLRSFSRFRKMNLSVQAPVVGLKDPHPKDSQSLSYGGFLK